ncbi:MAG TPA: rRNA maturation RNase YbeY [Chloroflexota bacterium]
MRPTPEQPPNPPVEIEVEVDARVDVPRDALALIVDALNEGLRQERWQQPASLYVLVTDDEGIRAINREQRGVDQPTDVLSFPAREAAGAPAFVLPPGHPIHLGDIVLSYERAVAQAEQYGHDVRREIAYLVVHGLLHLLGYDHETEEERRAMRAHEEAILAALGARR